MKKKLFCFILAAFLFVGVPVKGYAAAVSPLVFGMSEDVVLAFLASLLGVSARETIESYVDLEDYSSDLRLGFTEYLAGSATAMELAEWIGSAVIGNINTDSIIWEKFYEYCIDNYSASSGGISTVPANNVLNLHSFDYSVTDSAYIYTNNSVSASINGIEKACSYYYQDSVRTYIFLVCASASNFNGAMTYRYNDQTVYYTTLSTNAGTQYFTLTSSPAAVNDQQLYIQNRDNSSKVAWSMIFGGYDVVAGFGTISNAMNGALSAIEKQDIIDGTSVLQLYNPAAAQNGLEIVPDPEDPNYIVIPAMLTADWYNFLKQFGPSGAAQFVAAYNALNAVQGVSTGAINGIYNNLGIASAINTASQAAQGTLTLSDNNVFPMASTIADAVTGVIPGALTPEVPDSGIDNESDQGLYKLPDLKDFFPFCIPFDLIDLLSCFVAEPETPQFVIALSTGEDTVTGQMDLHIWDNIASVLRGLELIAFTVGLILITRNIIRG